MSASAGEELVSLRSGRQADRPTHSLLLLLRIRHLLRRRRSRHWTGRRIHRLRERARASQPKFSNSGGGSLERARELAEDAGLTVRHDVVLDRVF